MIYWVIGSRNNWNISGYWLEQQIFTSRRIKISGSNPNLLSAVACDKLLGYPSNSQPFSLESAFKRRSLTICSSKNMTEVKEIWGNRRKMIRRENVWSYHDNNFIRDQLSLLHILFGSLSIFTSCGNFCPEQISSSNMYQTILNIYICIYIYI